MSGSDENKVWSEAVAKQYELDELDALCTWLDVNIELNQQRLESLTTRLGHVVTCGAAVLALLAATVRADAWPLTGISVVISSIAILIAVFGQRTVVRPDRDPTSTWDTLWGRRKVGELQAVLYRRRSVLFDDQRAVIDERSSALKSSSWILGFGTFLAAAAILVSRA